MPSLFRMSWKVSASSSLLLLTFCCLGVPIQGTGEKSSGTDQNTFQHVSWVGDQLQLGHTASQGTTLSSEHDALFSTGIPTQTSFSFPAAFVVLLLSSLSLPPTDVFSSLLLVILPSSSSIGCFTSPRKELTPVT